MQFKDTPVNRRMEISNTNANGYSGSEMRKYLISYSGSGGNFSVGLKDAGVPLDNDAIILKPQRYVASKGSGTAVSLIEDKIWLPTEREMFRSRTYSVAACETEANQTWLEYYNSDDRRKKPSAQYNTYWLASPSASSPAYFFCAVFSDGRATSPTAMNELGVAPAFCVK
jgi:hypothetical protein